VVKAGKGRWVRELGENKIGVGGGGVMRTEVCFGVMNFSISN